MKFSHQWLAALVPGLTAAPEELSSLITIHTAESEGVARTGTHLAQVCAARVLSVEPIAGSHNQQAVVDTGRYGTKTVVCGAPNCRAGMVTAYAPVGSTVGGKEIRAITIEGVPSEGMLCSAAELEVGKDHTGIVEIDANPGDAIPGVKPDAVIEIDNKSLTHRPDLWGHHGMAREVAAITGLPLSEPANLSLLPQGDTGYQIQIDAPEFCPRFTAMLVENVTVAPSPLWLQQRLTDIGLNPINNIVDITNYVMAEIAQPMHAFDADKVAGNTLFIRMAREGETCAALNGETYTLRAGQDGVVADANGPEAIAGVIGGAPTAINEQTTRVLFESANWHASTVRKTSSYLKVRTDASMRFEKAQDPANTVRAMARAIALLKELSPAARVVGLTDTGLPAHTVAPIALDLPWLRRKLGKDVSRNEVRDILERLQFGVADGEGESLIVSVPSWRATKDISLREDLVEEVGRMIGYGTITPAPPLVPSVVPPANPERIFRNELRDKVAARGFTEVYNYSFLSEEMATRFGYPVTAHVEVANPIAADQSLLRLSLVPRICGNVNENAKHLDRFALYEIGKEIHPTQPGQLPHEITHLIAAAYDRQDAQWAGNEAKLLAHSLLPGVQVQPSQSPRVFEHPARCADLLWQGEVIGRLFEFHPQFVEVGRASVLDIDIDAMQRLKPAQQKYVPVRRTPSSAFDLSVLANTRDLVGTLDSLIRRHAGEFLDAVDFVGTYDKPPIPAGKKSVTFRITVASREKTLSSAEVNAIREGIVNGLRESGYELRG